MNLLDAATRGNAEAVQRFLEARADPEAKDLSGNTALIHAAAKATPEAMQRLLAARADPEAKNNGGNTALIQAAANGHAEAVQRLLAARADPEAKDRFGHTALIKAAATGKTEAVQRLLEARADPEVKANPGYTALIHAAALGKTEAVQRLLEARADPEAKDLSGNTALIQAAATGTTEAVQRLLEARADPEVKDNGGNTALIKAAANGQAVAVQRLFEARADPEAKDNDGNTALIKAARNGKAEAVQRLLEARADPEAKDASGDTPLILAATDGRAEAVQCFLEAQANPSARGRGGRTALREAASSVHMDVVRRLLQARADPQAKVADDADELLHVRFIKEDNVCGRDILEHCFFDASEAVVGWHPDAGQSGKKLFKPQGRARSSTEGPRAWAVAWETNVPSSFGGFAAWFRDRDDLREHRLVALDTYFFKHVARSVPISHFISIREGVLCRELVDAMAAASIESGIFNSSATHAILNAVWEVRCRWVYLLLEYGLEIAMTGVAVLSAVDIRHGGKTTMAKIGVIAAILAKFIVDEAVQLCSSELPPGDDETARIVRKVYGVAWRMWTNVSDYAFLGISMCGCWLMASAEDLRDGAHEVELLVIAAWIFCLIMDLVLGLRAFTPFGPRMLPIVNSILDTKEFMIITFFVLLAFTMAFYTLGTRDAPAEDGFLASSALYAAFLHMFRAGILGDFDLFELEGVDPTFVTEGDGTLAPEDPPPTSKYDGVHTIFLAIAVLLTVGLMNLLVGILGNSYDRYEERSTELFLIRRAKLISRLGQLPWCRWLIWATTDWQKKGFWYTTRKDPGEDAVSMRATVKQVEKNLAKNLDTNLAKREKKLESKLTALEEKIEKLRAGQEATRAGQEDIMRMLRELQAREPARASSWAGER